ncbi:MAG: UDP-N-acetylmuramate dehydrogenase [Elusimicrobiota bacterium]|nr:UDP-N-acetylmuramate dehydrogenase [Elusimicrobiota bacterium]
MEADWRKALQAAVPAARLDEPLAPRTTFKIGGPADAFVAARDRAELKAALAVAREAGVPVFVLGWGSNLLVRDKGVRGLVVQLAGEFERVSFPGGGEVVAGAAARVPALVVACAERGLSGLEPIVGVPGTVGGALAMNAGTRDGEIGSFVKSVSAVDLRTGEERVLTPAQLAFTYRHSGLADFIALDATFSLKAADKADIMAVVRRYQQKRQETQPIHTYNVGSTFKNPPGRFVAQMVEQLGLKGHAVGGARISPLHANFIENFAGAKASDVLALVDLIRERVRAGFGVSLELEMKVVGE